ncbi:MAG: hypothetical protein HY812_02595 [Planctomycetes bacterium]|nr:hypothetical protein [Planctomycetota bacterium]
MIKVAFLWFVASLLPQGACARGEERGVLWIVHAEGLKSAAQAWREYREAAGWRVTLLPADRSLAIAERRAEIADLLRAAHRLHRESPRAQEPFAALLLGDADDAGIPGFYFPQTDPALRARGARDYLSDHPYRAAADEDAEPLFALGRVPARSAEEALAVLDKVVRYEADGAAGEWRNRVVYAAGEGRFGMFDVLFEWLFRQMVGRIVPDTVELSMTYAKVTSVYCPPPSELPDALLARLGEGALRFNYVGHGSSGGLDALRWRGERYPSLRVADLARLKRAGGGAPIALLACCSTGWFDLEDGRPCLAEALLLHRDGPIGVIAGSRVTHPYASVLLEKDVTRLLLRERVATLGELDLRAKEEMLRVDEMDEELDDIAATVAAASLWKCGLEEIRRMHVRMYNLLGDPALLLALPPRTDVLLEWDGAKLRGSVAGMAAGRATLSVETERESMARESEIIEVDDPDDPDAEKKARHNYALANDRVLCRVQTSVAAGRFVVDMGRLPEAARVVRVSAVGRGGSGGEREAVGSIRVP